MKLLREKELRCFCRSNPLLATYGLDKDEHLFVHVKVYKQSKIFAELIFTGGTVLIKCRNCLRWHRIIFQDTSATLVAEASEPQVIVG